MGLRVPALAFLMGRLAQLCRERRAIKVSNVARGRPAGRVENTCGYSVPAVLE
jgi:hypothetical protein